MTHQDELTPLNLPACSLRIRSLPGGPMVFDPVRRKFVRLTPEEWVRQHFLQFLICDRGYPRALIAVEMGFQFQRMLRRADIVVHDRAGDPSLIIECKAPDVGIVQSTFDQVSRYNRVIGAGYLAVTNGLLHYCWRVEHATGHYEFLTGVPPHDSTKSR